MISTATLIVSYGFQWTKKKSVWEMRPCRRQVKWAKWWRRQRVCFAYYACCSVFAFIKSTRPIKTTKIVSHGPVNKRSLEVQKHDLSIIILFIVYLRVFLFFLQFSPTPQSWPVIIYSNMNEMYFRCHSYCGNVWLRLGTGQWDGWVEIQNWKLWTLFDKAKRYN